MFYLKETNRVCISNLTHNVFENRVLLLPKYKEHYDVVCDILFELTSI